MTYEKIINHPKLRRIIERQPGHSEPHKWLDMDTSKALLAFNTPEDLAVMERETKGSWLWPLRKLMQK